MIFLKALFKKYFWYIYCLIILLSLISVIFLEDIASSLNFIFTSYLFIPLFFEIIFILVILPSFLFKKKSLLNLIIFVISCILFLINIFLIINSILILPLALINSIILILYFNYLYFRKEHRKIQILRVSVLLLFTVLYWRLFAMMLNSTGWSGFGAALIFVILGYIIGVPLVLGYIIVGFTDLFKNIDNYNLCVLKDKIIYNLKNNLIDFLNLFLIIILFLILNFQLISNTRVSFFANHGLIISYILVIFLVKFCIESIIFGIIFFIKKKHNKNSIYMCNKELDSNLKTSKKNMIKDKSDSFIFYVIGGFQILFNLSFLIIFFESFFVKFGGFINIIFFLISFIFGLLIFPTTSNFIGNLLHIAISKKLKIILIILPILILILHSVILNFSLHQASKHTVEVIGLLIS
jgi:hypothetical protein